MTIPLALLFYPAEYRIHRADRKHAEHAGDETVNVLRWWQQLEDEIHF